jgi:Protein of unknown function (DUF2800)
MLANLRPSSAHIWSVCAGYVRMVSAFPEDGAEVDADPVTREEGTACHHVAHAVSKGEHVTAGMLAPNGVTVTQDMLDTAAEWVSSMRQRCSVRAHFESPLAIDTLFPGMQGTADAWGWEWDASRQLRTLHIGDLKYGYRFVEVIENVQLVCYAAALLADISGLEDQNVRVVFHIFQPRAYGHDSWRSWSCRASDLQPNFNILRSAAALAMQPQAPCVPNPGCRNCRARHACSALQAAALRELETGYQSTPLELPILAADDELRRLKYGQKLLEARITGLEAQLEHAARAGNALRWHTLQSGRLGREVWKEGAARQVIALGKLFGQTVAKEPTLITPLQAKEKIAPELVAMYSHRLPQAAKLMPIDQYAAQRTFAKE